MKKTLLLLNIFLFSIGLNMAMAQVPSYVPSNGLVGWWPFNGNANDESGNGYNGTVNGATLTTDRFGVANKAYSFDGIDDYIAIANSSGLTFNSGVTFSAWINASTLKMASIVDKVPVCSTGNNSGFRINVRDNGEVHTGIGCYGVGIGSVAPNAYANNTWRLVTGTWGPDGIAKIYIDGQLIQSIQSNYFSISNSDIVEIGKGNYSSLYEQFEGKIDDIGIWNRALTQQEITNLYTSSTPISCLPDYVPTNGLVGYWPFCGNANDESGNGNNGTVNGATLTTDRFGNANKAYNFNGVSSKIVVNNSPSLNITAGQSISIACWVKHNSGATNVDKYFISKYSGITPTGPAYAIGTGNFGNVYTWHQISAGTANGIDIRGDNTMNDGNWHQVVSVLEMGVASRVYIDGILDSTVNFPLTGSIINTINLHFGCGANLAQYYAGNLDDIGIWNRVLTQQEITNLYTSSIPPACSITPASATVCAGDSVTLTASTSASNVSACASSDLGGSLQNGLVGYWPFCGNANDASGNGNNGTVNGATLTTDRFGNANSAYSFNGNSRIKIPFSSNYSSHTGTVSAWIYVDTFPTVNDDQDDIFGKGWGYPQLVLRNNGKVYISLANATNNFTVLGSNSSLLLNNWYFITAQYSPTSLSIYINGVLDNSASATSSFYSYCNSEYFVGGFNHIGTCMPNDNVQNITSKIDDIYLYNRTLSQSEIQQLYTQGQTTYAWSNGATTPSITVAPTSTTTYTCTATVNGASGSSTSTVTVNPLPTVNAGIDQILCSGNTVTLSASGAASYSWNNNISNGVAFSPAATGTCTVSGTDANGCVNSDDVVVTVNPLPTVNAGSDQMICAGIPITLNGSGATTYSWNNGVGNGVAFSPVDSNTYTVTGTDANGCTNTDAVFVMVHAVPSVNAGSDQSVCAGTAVTLSATGASTYAWNNNVSNGTAFTPTATSTYSVSGTDGNGCSNTDQVLVTVNPLPNVNAGADQSICKGDAVTLSGTGASTYAWNNNVTNGVAFNPIATATYSVAGTDANGCSNSDEVVVTVNEASASTLTESALDSYTLSGQTYTQSGTYTQVITNAAGCDSTITLNLTLSFTGLNELAQGIQLFPNPANDVLSIQSSSSLTGEYTLYDASGREVLRGTFTGTKTSVDVRNIAPGTYTLQAAELMERVVVLRK